MSDEHIGPCGKYCAVVDECDARGHEITRLRADLAAVTAERDRMREALSYYAEENYNGYNGSGAFARAALEGVIEPADKPTEPHR